MILSLLLRYWQSVALVAALSFGALMWHAHNVAEIDKGKAIERARVADSTLAAIKPQQAHVDTLYRTDTARVTKYATRTNELRDTLLVHLTDTVLVKQFVAASDSTIHACRDALNDCAESKRLSALEIAALRTKLATQPAMQKESHIGFGATFGLGATKPLNGPLAMGPSLTAGVTVRW